MSDYKICINATCDLPESYIKEHNLGLMKMSCIFEGETYGKEKELEWQYFYEKMKEGSLPTTSQINPSEAREYFEEFLKDTDQILQIAFSSGLSGTYNSLRMAAEELMEERPEVTIRVIDSLGASLGEGLLVHYAVTLKEQGKTLDEVAEWIETHKLNLVHMFTVDDLNHLYRGGRVSKLAATVGTMINLKPILHVDDEGHLIPLSKVRGRKKSLHTLVDCMEERIGSFKDQNIAIFISHGDALEDALLVKAEVEKRFGYTDFLINPIGPVIGTHSGPGTIALFFLGEKR